MKKVISIILLTLSASSLNGYSQVKALLVIDIQNFYFPGGRSELVEPEKAARNAALLIDRFRKEKLPVIYIRHNAEQGGEIHETVKPAAGEMIFSKDEVNCFSVGALNDFLKSIHVDTLVICGMQTHMCVEAAVRAGSDSGYRCILVHDACATRDLRFGERLVKSEDVHFSTLATLRSYAVVKSTLEYLGKCLVHLNFRTEGAFVLTF